MPAQPKPQHVWSREAMKLIDSVRQRPRDEEVSTAPLTQLGAVALYGTSAHRPAADVERLATDLRQRAKDAGIEELQFASRRSTDGVHQAYTWVLILDTNDAGVLDRLRA